MLTCPRLQNLRGSLAFTQMKRVTGMPSGFVRMCQLYSLSRTFIAAP